MTDPQPLGNPAPPSGLEWGFAFNDEFDDTSGMSGPSNGIARANWNSGWQTGPSPGGLGVINTATPPVQGGEIQYYDPSSIIFPGDNTCRFRLQTGTTQFSRTVRSGMLSTAGLMVLNPLTRGGVPAGPTNVTGPVVVEVKMRIPGPHARAGSYWPVVWMTNAGNYNNGSSFPGGTGWQEEIDLWEWYNGGATGATAGFHYHAAAEGVDFNSCPNSLDSTDLSLAYHTYTYWTDGSATKVWIDGIQATDVNPPTTQTRAEWAQPQYLMFAFQANSGANLPTSTAGSQTDMMLDYVRVWHGVTPTSSPILIRESMGIGENFNHPPTITKVIGTDGWAGTARMEHIGGASITGIRNDLTNIVNAGGTGISVQLNHGLPGYDTSGGDAHFVNTTNPEAAGSGPALRTFCSNTAASLRALARSLLGTTAGDAFHIDFECGNEVSNWNTNFTIPKYLLTYRYMYQGLKQGDPLCKVAPGSDINANATQTAGNTHRSNVMNTIPIDNKPCWAPFDYWRDMCGNDLALLRIAGKSWNLSPENLGPGVVPSLLQIGFDWLPIHPYGTGNRPSDKPAPPQFPNTNIETWQEFVQTCNTHHALVGVVPDNLHVDRGERNIAWNGWRFVKWIAQYAYDMCITDGQSAAQAAAHCVVHATEFGWTSGSWHASTTYPSGWSVYFNGQRYTSSQAVPNTIGDPVANPAYWNAGWNGAWGTNEAGNGVSEAEQAIRYNTAWRQWFGFDPDGDGVWLGGQNAPRRLTGKLFPFLITDLSGTNSFKYGLLYYGPRNNPNSSTFTLGEKGDPLTTDGAYRRTLAYASLPDPRYSNATAPAKVVPAPLAFPSSNTVGLFWSAPDDGGSPIIDYAVTLNPPELSPYHTNNAALGMAIHGLQAGVTYTARVRAINAVGQGPLSDPVTFTVPSDVTGRAVIPLGISVNARGVKTQVFGRTKVAPGFAVRARGSKHAVGKVVIPLGFAVRARGTASIITPQQKPDPPTVISAISGQDGYSDVSWNVSPNDHGSPVLGYRVTSSTGLIRTTAANVLSVRFAPLTNGIAVSFTVAARNLAGYGVESASSNTVTPAGPPPRPPDPPLSVLATVTSASTALVAFTASPDTHGNPIINYRITPSTGPSFVTATLNAIFAPPSSGTYTFTVAARTVLGYGVESTVSNAVTLTVFAPATNPGLGRRTVRPLHAGSRGVRVLHEGKRGVKILHTGGRQVRVLHAGSRTVKVL